MPASFSHVALVVVLVTQAAELALARQIRQRVFVDEQHVPPELEADGLDARCTHYLALDGDQAVATARARLTPAGYKLERVAVLAARRGQAIGTALVRHALSDAPAASAIYVHAQHSALDFWIRQGFVAEGPAFEEAGIWHSRMVFSPSACA
jgi:predicted GNAT family N-acyltransferase